MKQHHCNQRRRTALFPSPARDLYAMAQFPIQFGLATIRYNASWRLHAPAIDIEKHQHGLQYLPLNAKPRGVNSKLLRCSRNGSTDVFFKFSWVNEECHSTVWTLQVARLCVHQCETKAYGCRLAVGF